MIRGKARGFAEQWRKKMKKRRLRAAPEKGRERGEKKPKKRTFSLFTKNTQKDS
ncbi:MAG: hypothetical protein LUD78_12355 [Clostridiales bacterium]|nr:hypothetical protein [Clostridiales bacterium]